MRYTGRQVLLVVCLLALAQRVGADGGFFPQFAGSAESADQRAIVVYDGARETLVLQTAYEGDSSDFAWVIPVPALLSSEDIGTIAADIFNDLYYLTEPAAYGYYGYRAQGLCGCSSGGESQRFGSVKVWETLQVDDYEVTTLSTEDSSDLEAWLNANGYAFPSGHQDELDYYVDKSWFFVAAKINPAAGDKGNAEAGPPGFGGGDREEGEEMRPLRLSFTTPEPTYPLRISEVSSQGEVEVLLYVIAHHRITPTNYNCAEVQLTSAFRGGDFPAYYEEQFRSSLARAGAGSLLVEYAGMLPTYLVNAHGADLGVDGDKFYITRLRSYLTPDDMPEDVIMTQAATDDEFAIRVAAVQPVHTNMRLAGVGLLFVLAAASGLASDNWRNLARFLLLAAVIAVLVI